MSWTTISGKRLWIADLRGGIPELPITGLTYEERVYEMALSEARGYRFAFLDPNFPTSGRIAAALDDIIRTGQLTEPGIYGIEFPDNKTYLVYTIDDPDPKPFDLTRQQEITLLEDMATGG